MGAGSERGEGPDQGRGLSRGRDLSGGFWEGGFWGGGGLGRGRGSRAQAHADEDALVGNHERSGGQSLTLRDAHTRSRQRVRRPEARRGSRCWR